MSADCALIQTTYEFEQQALWMRHDLVDRKLAVHPRIRPMLSIYRWDGRIEIHPEYILTAEIRESRFKEVEDFIVARHDYDLPCVIGLPLASGKQADPSLVTDCILASTDFTSEAQANQVALAIVYNKLAAGAKVYPAETPGEHTVSAETTRRNLTCIENVIAMTNFSSLPGLTNIPIVAGKPEFLQWIRTNGAYTSKKSNLREMLSLPLQASEPSLKMAS